MIWLRPCRPVNDRQCTAQCANSWVMSGSASFLCITSCGPTSQPGACAQSLRLAALSSTCWLKMKLNNEDTDYCTLKAKAFLQGLDAALSDNCRAKRKSLKLCCSNIVFFGSRMFLQELQAESEQLSVAEGVKDMGECINRIVARAGENSHALLTRSFNPNGIMHNEVRKVVARKRAKHTLRLWNKFEKQV